MSNDGMTRYVLNAPIVTPTGGGLHVLEVTAKTLPGPYIVWEVTKERRREVGRYETYEEAVAHVGNLGDLPGEDLDRTVADLIEYSNAKGLPRDNS